ncbi:MAG: hypothetical protein J7J93_00990 [Candidatus Aenigmarchaeota archaeon]|nr:hypothetical protein [Candidatus Aenigmarchaeota archaeon]
MNWEEFLRPEWKKIILPAIFILIFIILIKISYDAASLSDKYLCDIFSLVKQIHVCIEQNNTECFEESQIILENLSNNFMNDLERNRLLKNEKIFFNVFMNMKKINPLLPFPCEHNMDVKYCRFYISKETYDCYANFTIPENIIFHIIFGFYKKEMREYKKVSFFDISLNTLILFIEGYLISCLILFCYRKIIRRVKNELQTDYELQTT